MTLYKYVDCDVLGKILEGSIRFTQPGAFNDPFEMVPELLVPKELGDSKVNLRFSVTAPRRSPPVHELDPSLDSADCSDLSSRRILASLNQEIGVLSLSRNGSSLLMWSHYADRYKGAIVEFDSSHEFFRGKFDVQYRETRPRLHVRAYLDDDTPIPIAELCVKPKDWEYEAEVRVVRNLSDCNLVGGTDVFPVYTQSLPMACIKSIVLGERMSVENQRRIYRRLGGSHVSLYLDAISNWGYGFRREPIYLPGMPGPIVSPRTAHLFSHQDDQLGEAARWQIENNKWSAMTNHTL